jgi:hypothetical protein
LVHIPAWYNGNCVITYFPPPIKIEFAQNGIFGLMAAIFAKIPTGFHLTFSKLNRDQHKNCGILAQNVKTT